MIILDSSAYYKLGRNAILHDDFDKALGYFIKAGDYHSQINATVLLCFFGDYYLAHSQYLQMLVTFGNTHNVTADLMWAMRGGGEDMFKNLSNGKSRKRDKGKVSATKSKLFQFGFLNSDSQLERLQDEIEQQLLDFDDASLPELPRFTVLGSKQYFDVQTERMRRAFLAGDMEQGTKYAQQLMDADSNVTTHLELKLMLYLAHNKLNEAHQLAQRLQNLDDLTTTGKFVVAEVMLLQGDKQGLANFLRKTQFKTDLDDVEWRKLIALATHVGDYQLAQQFADQMLPDESPSVNLDFLLSASIAYFNAGQKAKAIDLVKRVYLALPNNVCAKAVLNYYTTHADSVAKLNVAYPHRFFTPYQIPSAVTDVSLCALQDGCPPSDVFWHLSVLIYAENGYYLGTNNVSNGKYIVSLMENATNLDANSVQLMLTSLLNEYTSPRLKSAFLYYLTKYYDGNLVVTTSQGENVLPQGLFDGVTDAQRLVLCSMASSHKVTDWDVSKAVELYNAYAEQMQGQDTFVFAETLFSSLTAGNN